MHQMSLQLDYVYRELHEIQPASSMYISKDTLNDTASIQLRSEFGVWRQK